MVFGSNTDFGSGFGVGGSPPPEYSGGDDPGDMFQCYQYRLQYTIELKHSYLRKIWGPRGNYLTQVTKDWEGEITIKAGLSRWKSDNKCIWGAIDIPPEEKCQMCWDRYIKGARYFYIRSLTYGGTPHDFEWEDLDKMYLKKACPPVVDTTNGHYGFTCEKHWMQCGRNKKLEKAITPGPGGVKSITLQSGAWDITESGDKSRYDLVCMVFEKLLEARKGKYSGSFGGGIGGITQQGGECGECRVLNYMVINTLFGDVGSLTGGQDHDCDGDWANNWEEHQCGNQRKKDFENWMRDQAGEDWSLVPYPRPFKIPKCDDVPGCAPIIRPKK